MRCPPLRRLTLRRRPAATPCDAALRSRPTTRRPVLRRRPTASRATPPCCPTSDVSLPYLQHGDLPGDPSLFHETRDVSFPVFLPSVCVFRVTLHISRFSRFPSASDVPSAFRLPSDGPSASAGDPLPSAFRRSVCFRRRSACIVAICLLLPCVLICVRKRLCRLLPLSSACRR